MKQGEYWKKRFKKMEEVQNDTSLKKNMEIQDLFDRSMCELDKKIRVWYQRLADNNGVSMVEAKKLLSNKELKEFRWSLEEYIQHAKDNELGQFEKELENASARVHIGRLEALKVQVQAEMERMFGNYTDSIDQHILDLYNNEYYHTAFEIQKGISVGSQIQALNKAKVESIIRNPWAVDEQSFSDRIWKDKKRLINTVHQSLTKMCITGDSPDTAIKEIQTTMNTTKRNASRLVMTESAVFANKARKECMENLGVQEFEVIETLDGITCPKCGSMDGKHFPMSEYVVGVTAPPFHPNCRGCTCPYFDDEFTVGEERAARNEEGKTYNVPANMTYEEWKQSFVNGNKSGLQEIKTEKEMTVEEIKKQISENNARIEILTSEYSQKHQTLENALLFGNENVDTLNRMSKEVQEVKADLDDMIAKTDALKEKLPQESVRTVQSVVVEGKNIIGDVDYTSPDFAKFNHVIEKSMHAQGFDGTPSVVEYEDFKKAMEESGFYAERTYSAKTQKELDEYREQLYNGKWYVDCSEGGAQYGQGMYCASCYDLTNNKQMGGIGMEMSHYQQIGLGRGNGFYYTEGITLRPDAKIFEIPSGKKADEYIEDAFRNAYMKKFASKEQLAQVEQYIELREQISNLTFTGSSEFIDNLYEKSVNSSIGLESLIKEALTAMEDITDGRTYHSLKNPGVLVTEMGYDAIKATDHGESGSYTVILNRTKVLFCKGGSVYGN